MIAQHPRFSEGRAPARPRLDFNRPATRLDGYGWLLVLAAAGVINVVISMLSCVVLVVVIGIFQGPFVDMATGVLATLGFQACGTGLVPSTVD